MLSGYQASLGLTFSCSKKSLKMMTWVMYDGFFFFFCPFQSVRDGLKYHWSQNTNTSTQPSLKYKASYWYWYWYWSTLILIFSYDWDLDTNTLDLVLFTVSPVCVATAWHPHHEQRDHPLLPWNCGWVYLHKSLLVLCFFECKSV